MTFIGTYPAGHMVAPQRHFSYKGPNYQWSPQQIPQFMSPYAQEAYGSQCPQRPVSRGFFTAPQKPWTNNLEAQIYRTEAEHNLPFYVRPVRQDTYATPHHNMNLPPLHREPFDGNNVHSNINVINSQSPAYHYPSGFPDRCQREHMPRRAGLSRHDSVRNSMPSPQLRSTPPRPYFSEPRRPAVSNYRRYNSGGLRNDRLLKRSAGPRQQPSRDRVERGGMRGFAAGPLLNRRQRDV
ncbi:hypothetical protein K3495_g11359 [Podosphaera aphanis]|nr:hypothetical protein K3495_g11359 [Podosphaera aphanis]